MNKRKLDFNAEVKLHPKKKKGIYITELNEHKYEVHYFLYYDKYEIVVMVSEDKKRVIIRLITSDGGSRRLASWREDTAPQFWMVNVPEDLAEGIQKHLGIKIWSRRKWEDFLLVASKYY